MAYTRPVAHGLIGARMLTAVLDATVAEPTMLSLLALPLLLGWIAIRRSDLHAATMPAQP